MQRIEVPIVHATRENTADFGLFIGTDIPNNGLTIPFYKGSVEEGHNIPFECHGKAVIRSARISKRSGDIIWLERHVRMTQLFVGLGDAPFAMVLAPPSESGADVPDLDKVRCFILAPGHGIMLHKGTWHDFPMSVGPTVTCMTANSEEVVAALAAMKEPAEMSHGDVYKIDIVKRMGRQLHVSL
ncbi:MAG: ureidoglycolate lyase [Myxococcales bacterium]|nr:ureidoglycolate lyase [Myxococcales bacterium]